MTQVTWRAWNLVGLKVNQLCLDTSVQLGVQATDCSLTLRFKTPFRLQTPKPLVYQLNPQQPESLSPLLMILKQPLMRFSIASTGDCQLMLANGTLIRSQDETGWSAQGSGSLVSVSFSQPQPVGVASSVKGSAM
jgi:hypothetical protein